ncbi:hypothetical protein HHK36_019109 [Tetracentron sinense]|uniref:Mitochondrial glycoprotein n=1 Tax=Tetracentron sinense TaxID=13715 RepID=A0A834YZF2_TETSI|nr:hypothetical protein HHK36_019109 [Tetracentron sinense]
MAFSTILRRAASSVAPVAIRAIGTHRNYHSVLFSALKNTTLSGELCRRTFLPALHFSSLAKKSSSNDTLLRTIDSEIKCAEESDDHDREDEIPDGFPFEIQDKPGLGTLSLSREYQGEIIKVVVHMADLDTCEDEGDDDEGNDDDSEKSSQSSIPLVVSVSKGSGRCLEFGCIAFPDEISIDSLSVKDPESSEDDIAYEGPDFSDLDENLQKAFHKYLEVRGIKPSTTNFLHEYMINKESKEYLLWLKNLKNFIEK